MYAAASRPRLHSCLVTSSEVGLGKKKNLEPYFHSILSNSKLESFHSKLSSLNSPNLTLKNSNKTSLTYFNRRFLNFRVRGIADESKDATDDEAITEPESKDWSGIVSSITLLGFWGSFCAYAFFFSPNFIPTIDKYLIEKLLGLKGDDGFEINAVIFSLWNVMGLLPLMYSMMLIPSARGNKLNVPVWPFSTLSFFVGAFALLPYFSIWEPKNFKLSENEKNNFVFKLLDSKITAIALTAGLSFLTFNSLTCDEYFWKEFIQYFNGSRFIHITSLDFLILTFMLPFWMYNDMEIRKWDGKNNFLFFLTFFPLLGPAIYLILRPKIQNIED